MRLAGLLLIPMLIAGCTGVPDLSGSWDVGEVSRRSVNWGKQMPGKFTASWTGEVDASGTKISGTWQLTLADGFEKHGKFTASRLSR